MDSIVQVDDLVGRPFVKGGRDLETGVDCYGLLIEMHRRLGKTIPDFRSPEFAFEMEELIAQEKSSWVSHWEYSGQGACPLGECLPGRSLLFRVKGAEIHVGFIHRPFRFIHVWEDTSGVTIERISLWKQRIVGVYEFNG